MTTDERIPRIVGPDGAVAVRQALGEPRRAARLSGYNAATEGHLTAESAAQVARTACTRGDLNPTGLRLLKEMSGRFFGISYEPGTSGA